MKFEWILRVNVVKGVVEALSYMHHDCSPLVIHRDVSSNNVLLDSDYEAHVSDFGTSRLLKPDSSNWTSLAGTVDYIAPGDFSWFISYLQIASSSFIFDIFHVVYYISASMHSS